MNNMNGNKNFSANPVTNMIQMLCNYCRKKAPVKRWGACTPFAPMVPTSVYKGSQFSGFKLSWFGRLR